MYIFLYIILSTHTGAEFILVNMDIPFFAVKGDLNVRAVLRWGLTAPKAIPSFQHGLIAINHKNAIIGISIDPVSYSCCNISCHTSIRDLPWSAAKRDFNLICVVNQVMSGCRASCLLIPAVQHLMGAYGATGLTVWVLLQVHYCSDHTCAVTGNILKPEDTTPLPIFRLQCDATDTMQINN